MACPDYFYFFLPLLFIWWWCFDQPRASHMLGKPLLLNPSPSFTHSFSLFPFVTRSSKKFSIQRLLSFLSYPTFCVIVPHSTRQTYRHTPLLVWRGQATSYVLQTLREASIYKGEASVIRSCWCRIYKEYIWVEKKYVDVAVWNQNVFYPCDVQKMKSTRDTTSRNLFSPI